MPQKKSKRIFDDEDWLDNGVERDDSSNSEISDGSYDSDFTNRSAEASPSSKNSLFRRRRRVGAYRQGADKSDSSQEPSPPPDPRPAAMVYHPPTRPAGSIGHVPSAGELSGRQRPASNSPCRPRGFAPPAAKPALAAAELSDSGGEQSPPRRGRAMRQRPAYRSLATPSAAKEDFLGILAPGAVVAARGNGGLCCARVVGRAEAGTAAGRAREVGQFLGARERGVDRVFAAVRLVAGEDEGGDGEGEGGRGIWVVRAEDLLLALPLRGDEDGERISKWFRAIAERRGFGGRCGGFRDLGVEDGGRSVPVLEGVAGTGIGVLEVGTMVWVDIGVREDKIMFQPGYVAGVGVGERRAGKDDGEEGFEAVILFGEDAVLRKPLGDLLPFVPEGRSRGMGVVMGIAWAKYFEAAVIGRAQVVCKEAGRDAPEWANRLVIEHDLTVEAREVWDASKEMRDFANNCAAARTLLLEAEEESAGETERDSREELLGSVYSPVGRAASPGLGDNSTGVSLPVELSATETRDEGENTCGSAAHLDVKDGGRDSNCDSPAGLAASGGDESMKGIEVSEAVEVIDLDDSVIDLDAPCESPRNVPSPPTHPSASFAILAAVESSEDCIKEPVVESVRNISAPEPAQEPVEPVAKYARRGLKRKKRRRSDWEDPPRKRPSTEVCYGNGYKNSEEKPVSISPTKPVVGKVANRKKKKLDWQQPRPRKLPKEHFAAKRSRTACPRADFVHVASFTDLQPLRKEVVTTEDEQIGIMDARFSVHQRSNGVSRHPASCLAALMTEIAYAMDSDDIRRRLSIDQILSYVHRYWSTFFLYLSSQVGVSCNRDPVFFGSINGRLKKISRCGHPWFFYDKASNVYCFNFCPPWAVRELSYTTDTDTDDVLGGTGDVSFSDGPVIPTIAAPSSFASGECKRRHEPAEDFSPPSPPVAANPESDHASQSGTESSCNPSAAPDMSAMSRKRRSKSTQRSDSAVAGKETPPPPAADAAVDQHTLTTATRSLFGLMPLAELKVESKYDSGGAVSSHHAISVKAVDISSDGAFGYEYFGNPDSASKLAHVFRLKDAAPALPRPSVIPTLIVRAEAQNFRLEFQHTSPTTDELVYIQEAVTSYAGIAAGRSASPADVATMVITGVDAELVFRCAPTYEQISFLISEMTDGKLASTLPVFDVSTLRNRSTRLDFATAPTPAEIALTHAQFYTATVRRAV